MIYCTMVHLDVIILSQLLVRVIRMSVARNERPVRVVLVQPVQSEVVILLIVFVMKSNHPSGKQFESKPSKA